MLKKDLADEVRESLPLEKQLLFQKLMQEHNISCDDPTFLFLLLLMGERASLQEVESLIHRREQELQALLLRIETASSTLCAKANEFVIETTKLRSEIQVSDNIAKHVIFQNRQSELRGAGSRSLAPQTQRIKALPMILVVAGGAFLIGIIIATLIFASVR